MTDTRIHGGAERALSDLLRVLAFTDRHSGLIAAVGLVFAAVGLFLTAKQLHLYRQELRDQTREHERLAWERILNLLHQVARFAAEANLSSVVHSPYAQQLGGYLPPEFEAKYGPAQENLLSYWHQLRVELNLMPEGPLVAEIEEFVAKYDRSADSRASKEFLNALPPITDAVTERAQKSFSVTRG